MNTGYISREGACAPILLPPLSRTSSLALILMVSISGSVDHEEEIRVVE